eukprot:8576076-Heterocapsa_arctica.AAC.1
MDYSFLESAQTDDIIANVFGDLTTTELSDCEDCAAEWARLKRSIRHKQWTTPLASKTHLPLAKGQLLCA